MEKLELKIIQNDIKEAKKRMDRIEKKLDDLIQTLEMIKTEINSSWRN